VSNDSVCGNGFQAFTARVFAFQSFCWSFLLYKYSFSLAKWDGPRDNKPLAFLLISPGGGHGAKTVTRATGEPLRGSELNEIPSNRDELINYTAC
jgi:hypothetical protein